MQIVSKVTVLIIFFILFGCLAPQTYYYKPLLKNNKIFYKNDRQFDLVYYQVHYNDSLIVNTSFLVGSATPKLNSVGIGAKIISKGKEVNITGMKLQSKSLSLNSFDTIMNSKDSVFEYYYLKKYNEKWFKDLHKSRKDTINMIITFEDKTIIIPFYFNLGNQLETYPF